MTINKWQKMKAVNMNCLEWQIEILCWGNNFGNFEVLSLKLFIEHFVELDELFQKSGSHTPKPLVAAMALTQKLKTRKNLQAFRGRHSAQKRFRGMIPWFLESVFRALSRGTIHFFHHRIKLTKGISMSRARHSPTERTNIFVFVRCSLSC